MTNKEIVAEVKNLIFGNSPPMNAEAANEICRKLDKIEDVP